jgi:hypothetical protein
LTDICHNLQFDIVSCHFSSNEKQKEKIKVLRENNSSMTKILGNKENDVTNFLSSSKSFSQYNKERMDIFFKRRFHSGVQIGKVLVLHFRVRFLVHFVPGIFAQVRSN